MLVLEIGLALVEVVLVRDQAVDGVLEHALFFGEIEVHVCSTLTDLRLCEVRSHEAIHPRVQVRGWIASLRSQ